MPEVYTFLDVQSILTPSRSEAISASSPQIAALQNEQMIEFVHWLNGEFIFAAHGRHHNGGFSWMKRTSNFNVYTHSSLSAAIAAGAATFTLASAANWDSTGRSAAETTRGALDFIDHTSKASNTLTVSTVAGAETVTIAHGAGNRVHRLIPAPSDLGRVHQFWVNTVPYGEDKFTGQFPCYRRYMMHGQFFLLPRGSVTADGTLLYEKAPTSITAIDTETNIPRRFLRWAVYMTLHHLYMIRKKRGDTLTTLQLAERELDTALLYDSVGNSSINISLASH